MVQQENLRIFHIVQFGLFRRQFSEVRFRYEDPLTRQPYAFVEVDGTTRELHPSGSECGILSMDLGDNIPYLPAYTLLHQCGKGGSLVFSIRFNVFSEGRGYPEVFTDFRTEWFRVSAHVRGKVRQCNIYFKLFLKKWVDALPKSYYNNGVLILQMFKGGIKIKKMFDGVIHPCFYSRLDRNQVEKCRTKDQQTRLRLTAGFRMGMFWSSIAKRQEKLGHKLFKS